MTAPGRSDSRPAGRGSRLRSLGPAVGTLCAAVLFTAALTSREAPVAEERLREAARLRGQALAEMEDGNYGRALQSLLQLADILPDNILPPVNQAICLFRLNQPERALTQIRRAQELDPDNPQMLYALARILEQEGAYRSEWGEVVDRFAEAHPRDVRPYYLRAEMSARGRDWPAAVESLQAAVRRDSENLVLLLELLVAGAEARDLEATQDALDAVEDRLNGFEGALVEYADRLRELVEEEQAEALRPPALVLRNILRPSDLYQLGLIPLTGGQQAGGQMFPQLDFDPPLPKSIQGGQDIALAFVDATASSALQGIDRIQGLARAPEEQHDELLFFVDGQPSRASWTDDRLSLRSLEVEPSLSGRWLYQDIDQDGISDIVSADPAAGAWLYSGISADSFTQGAQILAPFSPAALAGLFPLDVDHDGDLDLFLARHGAPDLYLRNNGDSSWAERATELGLNGGSGETTDLVSADFDDDGDLDLLTVHAETPPSLYLNRLAGPLVEAGHHWGLDRLGGARGVHSADFDGNGMFDLLIWGAAGGIYLNLGDRFEAAPLPEQPVRDWRAVEIGDFDNDGDADALVVTGAPPAAFLLRNQRSSFVFERLDVDADGVQELVQGDFDHDGDLDVAAGKTDGTLRLWRNEGGNRNQWVRLRLKGRNDNNSKNNTQGLFTRIEARIGDSFQALIGNGGVNHLGLGASRQADVIRVVWTNGLAQTWLQVGANRTLVEEQVLKGSCPFLYTWNGRGFEFVTDLMWRSPLGMTQADGSQAPHQSARDYVLVPGERLVPSGGELWLHITEELWETVYVDRLELIAVDHPQGSQLVVDEAFRPPPYPTAPPVHWIDRRLAPVAAHDDRGRDVLSRVVARDEIYVDELPLSRYQGLTGGHHLEVTFEEVPADEQLRLVLWGWIFPTDSSINFALSQNRRLELRPPILELLDRSGEWQTLEPFLGLPNGKRKAVVTDLTGRLPAGRVTLRISTSMQIYWDAVTMSVGEPQIRERRSRLEPAVADLHYRGYSRLYRESSSGPHLFDYERVSTGPRYRDMAGRFTRFGDVTGLLRAEDDLYVVMNAGDELTVRFDASRLPKLPERWRRDWILYTDGWVKDGDLHTAHSQTVDPLPYHGMSAYPDLPEHRYPSSERQDAYLNEYQTRLVTDEPFRRLLRAPSSSPE